MHENHQKAEEEGRRRERMERSKYGSTRMGKNSESCPTVWYLTEMGASRTTMKKHVKELA